MASQETKRAPAKELSEDQKPKPGPLQPGWLRASCNCGRIVVTIQKPDLFDSRNGHICHCINCQKTSGSAYAANLIIESKYVELLGAENLNVYLDVKTNSGGIVERYFCAACGNPIKSETEKARGAGNVILKMGIFREIPTPEMETFNVTRHPWVKPLSGAIQYKITRDGEKLPTPE